MKSNSTLCGFIAVAMFLPVSIKAENSTSFSKADFDKIDAYIETQLEEANIPGAALAIVEDDRVTHVRGFGIAGPDRRPVTAETAFFIGSTSKSFTALAIMQLVEAGKVELDAPVRKYLPWFRVADPVASSQIKVRHLLHHSSGISHREGRTHLTSRDMSDKAIERRVRALCNARLTAPVGESNQYSNANYSILGAIIESASGQSYEDYIQENIFDPLEMTNSFASEEVARQHDLATGYRYWFGQPVAATNVPHPRGDLPAGLLISCANDMGNYLSALMNGGIRGNTRILSASGVSNLHTADKDPNSGYAMGWGVGTFHNTRIIGHDGMTPTSYVGMAIFPEHHRAFVLLINAQNCLSGPAVGSLPAMIRLPMIGKMALPVAKAPRVQTDLALLCVLLVGQVIVLVFSGRRILRWWKYPDTRPRKKRWIVIRGSLFFLVNVGIAVGLLWWVPHDHEVQLSGLMLYAPDAGWLILINGTIAIMACIVSLGMTFFLLRQAQHIHTVADGNL